MESIPAVLERTNAGRLGAPALRGPAGAERRDITFSELFAEARRFSAGLRAAGVRPGDRVLLFADNSPRWLVADLGILRAGAVDVPRGADVTPAEAEYIARHSGAVAAVVGRPGLLDRLPGRGAGLRAVVCLEGRAEGAATFAEHLASGAGGPEEPVEPGGLATIVYTSGTTGTPKGVMLSHANILHNVQALPDLLGLSPGDRFLSVLPAWHMFERTVEYTALSRGAVVCYSGLRTLREDLRSERPQYLAAVPRLWEGLGGALRSAVAERGPLARFLFRRLLSFAERRARLAGRLVPERPEGTGAFRALAGLLFDAPFAALARRVFSGRARAALGGRLRAGVSGGGLLPLHLDVLFAAVGVPLLVGYGLTETSPVVTLRRPEANVLGTIGRAVPGTEVRVTGAAGAALPAGEAGEVEVRGAQVMAGYYGDPEGTARVLRPDGFFRTGDLGVLTPAGDLVFRGRAKETIVLSGGENVEPGPIEARILESPFVRHALVVGQDRRHLAALLVPDGVLARREAAARGITVERLLRDEVARLVSTAAGFKTRERVLRVALIDREFSVEDGTLTPTMKVRRGVVAERYREDIEGLYRN